MSPETVTAIQNALAPVAAKIGEGAAYGWEVVVRQQYIDGITALIGSAFCLVFAGILALTKPWKWERDSDDAPGFLSLIATVAVFSLPVLSLLLTTAGVHRFLNPDYYAFQFFIDLVR